MGVSASINYFEFGKSLRLNGFLLDSLGKCLILYNPNQSEEYGSNKSTPGEIYVGNFVTVDLELITRDIWNGKFVGNSALRY